MYNILKQKINKTNPLSINNLNLIDKIKVIPNKPTTIYFNDGSTIISSCLKCPNTPCCNFSKSELNLKALPDCAYNTTNNTCPANAISIDKDTGIPNIDSNKCIGCGICAFRCPTKAIYIKNGSAIINSDVSENDKAHYTTVNFDEFNDTLNVINKLKNEGTLVFESDLIMSKIYKDISNLNKMDSNLPNLLVRNILLTLGTIYNSSKIGDNNFRMDGLLRNHSQLGVCEIEFGSDLLNSPRNILDDIAVISSRYSNNHHTLYPLIISLEFPNTRSEYWRVIQDIKQVLNIKINSISLGALLLLLWNLQKIDILAYDFYADCHNLTIREVMKSILNRNINLSIGCNSILEVNK